MDQSCVDYDIGGCPVSWLNVKTVQEAVEWHLKNCPHLEGYPIEFIEYLAKNELKRKIKASLEYETEWQQYERELKEELGEYNDVEDLD